jgi:hypothetical protein
MMFDFKSVDVWLVIQALTAASMVCLGAAFWIKRKRDKACKCMCDKKGSKQYRVRINHMGSDICYCRNRKGRWEMEDII